ncbi:hypothetical protein BJ165DRAFT_165297 [Panaeolus papilionaceus]|nr:hypothetical protein BJ165DRAFT_165297 [Panaeolus papilionaceus]
MVPLDLLTLCLSYVDLVQALQKSPAVSRLLDLLSLGTPQIKAKVVAILFDFVQLESLRPSILQPRTIDDLLHAILVDGDDVAHVSFHLLKYCFQISPNPIALLPPAIPKRICRLLDTNRRYAVLAALTLVLDMLNRVDAMKPLGKGL